MGVSDFGKGKCLVFPSVRKTLACNKGMMLVGYQLVNMMVMWSVLRLWMNSIR